MSAVWWADRARALTVGGAVVVFVFVGGMGAFRYLRGFWLYRGFPPPRDPAFVQSPGTVQELTVASSALGGRRQQVVVYLPPGYARDAMRRYPVLYLLHGFPGRPAAFLLTVRAGVVEDELVALRKMQPLILVMPFGSTGTFTDEEWADGVRPHQRWETFVARDLVRAVDARYRTVRAGGGRGLAGLSEGGYGALNIGLHHPGEFGVLESWSGYERAANLRSIFGGERRLLRWNSPLVQIAADAPALRRLHRFVWFYSGSDDPLRRQNEALPARWRARAWPTGSGSSAAATTGPSGVATRRSRCSPPRGASMRKAVRAAALGGLGIAGLAVAVAATGWLYLSCGPARAPPLSAMRCRWTSCRGRPQSRSGCSSPSGRSRPCCSAGWRAPRRRAGSRRRSCSPSASASGPTSQRARRSSSSARSRPTGPSRRRPPRARSSCRRCSPGSAARCWDAPVPRRALRACWRGS